MGEWGDLFEPIDIIAKDDPMTCAIYGRDNKLLDLPGWKRLKTLAKREKKILRMVNQAKLRSYNHAPKYKFGFLISRDCEQAVKLDAKNRNSIWKDCTQLDIDQFHEYKTFTDKGKDNSASRI